jgi:hypothetical protein
MNTIERKASIVMAWLQIAAGLIILSISGYRFEAVNIVVTFVVGIFLPLMALGKLIRFKKRRAAIY